MIARIAFALALFLLAPAVASAQVTESQAGIIAYFNQDRGEWRCRGASCPGGDMTRVKFEGLRKGLLEFLYVEAGTGSTITAFVPVEAVIWVTDAREFALR